MAERLVGDVQNSRSAQENGMKRTVIRYRAKPDAADRNAGLVEKVFEELKAKAPEGIRYLVLRLEDDSFVHFVETQEGAAPLPSLEAFKAFQAGIRDRCIEPPVPNGATIVGNYRMLSEH
jgi:radical SAM superfamily enzyme with C-terminal helix-hairpin-helix motif